MGLSDATVAEIVKFTVLNFVSGRRDSVAFVKKLQVRSQSCNHVRTVESYDTNLRLIELIKLNVNMLFFRTLHLSLARYIVNFQILLIEIIILF